MTNKNITIDSLDRPNPQPVKPAEPKEPRLLTPAAILPILIIVVVIIGSILMAYSTFDYMSIYGNSELERGLATLLKWVMLLSPVVIVIFAVYSFAIIVINYGKRVGLVNLKVHQTNSSNLSKNNNLIVEGYYNVAMEDAKQSGLRNVTNYAPSTSHNTTSKTDNGAGVAIEGDDTDPNLVPINSFL